MKRYNEISAHYSGESCMVEDSEGEWVKWEPQMDNDWISVEKELPPFEEWLWVWNGCFVIHIYYNKVSENEFKGYLSRSGVTHFQRLIRPVPPQTDEEKG